MKLAIVGQSHAVCVKDAAKRIDQRLSALGIHITFVLINEPRFKPWKERSIDTELGGYSLIPGLCQEILRATADADRIISLTGGMAHNIFGLTNHERAFDFVLPEDPSLPLLSDRELVPSDIVGAALCGHWNYQDGQWFLHALSKLVQQPVVHCESPAPICSEAKIVERAGVFADEIGKRGVTPASVRYKLWRLQSSLVMQQCKEWGIEFLSVPAASLDDNGFLHERALSSDAVHANGWYGECVLRQLVQTVDPDLSIGEELE